MQSVLSQCNCTLTLIFYGDDICEVIKLLGPTKSLGLDVIAGFVLKVSSEVVASFVKFIFNSSSLTQTVSTAWQKTVIIRALKKITESLFVIIGLFPLSVPSSEVFEFVTHVH
jgi:hypothetical protein